MTEVPEHLLRRSRERRAALGLGGGESGEEASGPAAAAPPAAAETAAAAVPVPAASEEVVEAAGPGGAVAVIEEAPPEPARPSLPRGRVPIWIMPVLVALPVWAFIYLGAFGSRTNAAANDPVARGNIVFHTAGCSGCHGANGEGGVGPALAGGDAVRTFPNIADHISWVHTGGAPFIGKTYGAQGHTVSPNNVMPAFGQDHGGPLTDQQIQDVVAYERQGL